jgi:arylsulfatase
MARHWLGWLGRLGRGWILALPAILLLASCGQEPAPRQIIFIMLDAARPDRFSCYGYQQETTPHLDALAREGVLFRNHFAQATATRRSLPSLFYSRYFLAPLFPASGLMLMEDPDNLFRRPDDEAISLPRALAAAGFVTAAVSAHTWLREGTRFAAEFSEFHDLATNLDTDGAYPPAERMIDYTLDWLRAHTEQDFFLYLHLMDTHFPHPFGTDAQRFFGPGTYEGDRFSEFGRPRDKQKPLTPIERRYLNAIYDGSLAYTDRHLGRLFTFLADSNRLADTVIVITADHGEHLLEQPGRLEHGGRAYDLEIRIPLIISYPARVPPRQVEAFTEGVDLLPTLLQLVEVDLPAGKRPDGLDLSALWSGGAWEREHIICERTLRESQYKCLFNDRDQSLLADQPPRLEHLKGLLFDLQADPAETTDLWNQEPARVRAMLATYRNRLLEPYRRYLAATTSETPPVPFSIGAVHFATDLLMEDLRYDALRAGCEEASLRGDWLRSKHWNRHWLFAREGAPACTVEFRVPNGIYDLAASLLGACDLRICGLDSVWSLQGSAFHPTHYLRSEPVPVGPVLVDQEKFCAVIIPRSGEGCLLFRSFGFTPWGQEAADEEIEAKRLQQLRALGYVD